METLTARHAALLCELAELRGTEVFQLAQADETTRAAYLTANRTALLAERDRLQQQLAKVAA